MELGNGVQTPNHTAVEQQPHNLNVVPQRNSKPWGSHMTKVQAFIISESLE